MKSSHCRAPGFVAGWGDLLPRGVGDATPALLVDVINAGDISYCDDDYASFDRLYHQDNDDDGDCNMFQ